MNWAHIHLFLNHIPVIGIMFGALLLLLAMLRKSEGLKRVSLGVFVLTALVAVPVYLTGEPAEEMVEHLPGVSEAVIEEHERAALLSLLAAGITGAVALTGLVAFRLAHRLMSWAVTATLVLSLAASGLMGWTANLGGRIRHTEIRADYNAPAGAETESRRKAGSEEEHER